MNIHQEKGSFILIDFLISGIAIGAGVYLMFSLRF